MLVSLLFKIWMVLSFKEKKYKTEVEKKNLHKRIFTKFTHYVKTFLTLNKVNSES